MLIDCLHVHSSPLISTCEMNVFVLQWTRRGLASWDKGNCTLQALLPLRAPFFQTRKQSGLGQQPENCFQELLGAEVPKARISRLLSFSSYQSSFPGFHYLFWPLAPCCLLTFCSTSPEHRFMVSFISINKVKLIRSHITIKLFIDWLKHQ